ncbi:MCE family protein [Mycolicibacillus parakoreensis]|uniref:MCE family protein n=1 Tax=Mycolicibacillus parakoreensis TaxID=1069221 RepID=A0ABY3U1Z3_9MYCO|nr:virulence factor Mce family protein [Mycolicibacillus parakoreensis]MCV7316469.1 MCE family protein [Mycolicibacillus parakoreensis]ULN52701.1 MCE family protein [Mycolicibacillus parakoreensis]HLR98522.1 MCE family protein [Mycolicibacillus parakoreensis]
MRTLEPPNRARLGLLGIIVTVLVVLFGQSMTSVPMLLAQPTYYGQFTDTGGINTGDKVRIAGFDVGKVKGIEIDGDHVVVEFSVGRNTIGTESRLRIRTDTILGRKVLEVEPRGAVQLRPGAALPLEQSTTPYQIYDAYTDITKNAADWDIAAVQQSLRVLADTIDETHPHLSAALDGVAEFSDTIGKRDEQITHLLAQANKVAEVLGDRSEQINDLLVNAQTLLAAFNQRGRAIDALLVNVTAVSQQVQGFIDDNPNFNHLLEQLRVLTDLLNERRGDLAQSFVNAAKFLGALNEAIASGPYFKVMIVNLLPYQVLQPFVDAAFKKRGIDPENFWRGAGLPEFQWPDPNGTRFPNGAPPPAPELREGTPDHPGPAVVPGSPCSYTPAADALPRPGNPLPCAGLDQGPYGPVPGGYPGAPDVVNLPMDPSGPPPGPGIPIAGLPGEAPPNVPGTPVPLPEAPPGARTEPVGPAAGPYPPPAPPPPPLDAPPAPPGPGPQLPAPFITPHGMGGSNQ